MDYKNYGNNRYRIVYGKYDGVQKEAVNKLYGIIAGYVPYVLVVSQADDIDIDNNLDENIVLVGTVNDNKHIQNLYQKNLIDAEIRAEGYSIKVFDNPRNPERTIMVLQGADDAGVLYAVYDFNRWYIHHKLKYNGYHYHNKYRPFIDKSLPFEKKGAPQIEYRGLWSWGHVIYDYRGYIDNMSRCKMNTVIIWNDFAPINAREIVEYAHMNAVKIIWGFTWCWGEAINPQSKEELDKWTDYVTTTYENQYRDLEGDGIYFQIFTETGETMIDGKSIAELSADWVNKISSAVYEKYPDLWIQFGIHASSIKNNVDKLSSVDPRMSIVWEDAGGFPYNYDPRNFGSFRETYDYTRRLLSLRGDNERFGAVLKGFTILNWELFEHQKGPFVLGENERHFLDKRAREKDFYWRYAAPYWIGQSAELASLIQLIAESPVKDRIITGLVDDGMWEGGTHISVELLAELLWNPRADINEVIKILFHSGCEI